MRYTAHNDSNVYILGAGFSVEAGMPVIKDFMNRMRDAAAWLPEHGHDARALEAMIMVLRYRLTAAAAAYRVPLDVENIEELFSLASAGSGELADDVTMAIAGTIEFCRQTAPKTNGSVYIAKRNEAGWTKPANWRPTGGTLGWSTPGSAESQLGISGHQSNIYEIPPYEFYVGLMCGYFDQRLDDGSNTIISLNYDTVVDDSMRDLSLPFRYADDGKSLIWTPARTQAPEGVKILKLHGSVNISSVLGYRGSDAAPATVDSQHAANGLSYAYASYRSLLQDGRNPTLVPPTWQKSTAGYLSTVWREAVAALGTATRIIIIGYSIPPTDQHFRYLLAAGLQDNISLRKVFFVNPRWGQGADGQELERRVLSLFREEHVRQGIIEPVPLTPRDFLMSPDSSPSSRERIGRTVNPLAFRDGTRQQPWQAYVPNVGPANF